MNMQLDAKLLKGRKLLFCQTKMVKQSVCTISRHYNVNLIGEYSCPFVIIYMADLKYLVDVKHVNPASRILNFDEISIHCKSPLNHWNKSQRDLLYVSVSLYTRLLVRRRTNDYGC